VSAKCENAGRVERNEPHRGSRRVQPVPRLLLEQSSELSDQQFFVTLKTADHSRQEIFRDYSIEVQGMPSSLRQKPHECKLAPAIAVTKGMDGVERRQEGRCTLCELSSR